MPSTRAAESLFFEHYLNRDRQVTAAVRRRSDLPDVESNTSTQGMTVKILVRDSETIVEAVKRFRTACRRSGLQVGRYVRITDRNRQRFYYESKSVRKRRQRHIGRMRMRVR